jgi:hypothetical protein
VIFPHFSGESVKPSSGRRLETRLPPPHAVTGLSNGETFAYYANGNTLAPARKCGVIVRVEGGLTYQQNFDADAAP